MLAKEYFEVVDKWNSSGDRRHVRRWEEEVYLIKSLNSVEIGTRSDLKDFIENVPQYCEQYRD